MARVAAGRLKPGPWLQGFVRIAVQTGSCLVPVMSFGENNIFQVSRPQEKSFMATVQKYVQLHPALTVNVAAPPYALLMCAHLQSACSTPCTPLQNSHASCQARQK